MATWDNEEVPQELKDASIVTIFKKGSRTECGNYRGISLLSVAGKILAKVLLNRLQLLSESIIPETQCGFRPGRGTTDMIFSARQVQEKCREQGRDLCLAFIDLTNAFDSVNREALWTCLARLGCRCRNSTQDQMCVLFIQQAERPCLLRKRFQNSNQDTGLQSCYSQHPLIWL